VETWNVSTKEVGDEKWIVERRDVCYDISFKDGKVSSVSLGVVSGVRCNE